MTRMSSSHRPVFSSTTRRSTTARNTSESVTKTARTALMTTSPLRRRFVIACPRRYWNRIDQTPAASASSSAVSTRGGGVDGGGVAGAGPAGTGPGVAGVIAGVVGASCWGPV